MRRRGRRRLGKGGAAVKASSVVLGLGHGELGGDVGAVAALGQTVLRLNSAPQRDGKGNREKRLNPARFQLTGRSGGSDRTLPPSVRSILERSKSPGIVTGRVRWTPTKHSQSPVQAVSFIFDRSDAEPPSDRTLGEHYFSVRSLLRSSSSPPVN